MTILHIREWDFITPIMLANKSKGWHVITDPVIVRRMRKCFKKHDRQIRNAQRSGRTVRRFRHRTAPHGKRRILAWRDVT